MWGVPLLNPVKKLSVVISCLNEEGMVPKYPAAVLDVLKKLDIPLQLVLVDDGSSDKTAEEIRKLQKAFPDVVGAFHPENRGLGAGLRTGFSLATGDTIVTLDGDLTFSPTEVENLLKVYDPYMDMVMGSPLLGQMKNVGLVRKMLSRGVNMCYQALFQKKITSASSIFRLYRAKTLKALILEADSFDINAEILFKMIRSGARITEVPATLGVRSVGESKINVVREITNHVRMFFKVAGWRFFGS